MNNNQKISISVKSGIRGMGNIASVYYNGAKELPKDVGSYSITIDLEEGDSFPSHNKLNMGTLTIKKAQIDVSAQNKEIVYGQEMPELTFESSGFVEGESFKITAGLNCSYVKWQDIGEYNIDIDVSSMSHKNYFFVGVQGKLKVNKGSFDMGTVSFSDETFIYDSKVKSLAITGDLTPGVSVSYNNNSRRNVGSQKVEAVINVNYNYNDIPVPGNILISNYYYYNYYSKW